MEKFMEYCMREDRNDAKTKPFGLEWRIGNLNRWRREAHGDCLATSVDFDGTRVEFRVYPQFPDDGRMEVHFPEELSRYQGLVTIRISEGRGLAAAKKEPGQRVVCLGPQMEHFRRNLNSEAWERLVFFFMLVNVSVNPRYEYKWYENASTVLQPVPHHAASRSQTDADVSPLCAPPNYSAATRLCFASCLSSNERLRQASISRLQKLKEQHERRKEHIHARRLESFLANQRERFSKNRLVPSLASLSLGKASEELNQLSKNDERVGESPSSTSAREASLFSQPGGTSVLRPRRLSSYPQGQPVPPSDDIPIPTGHSTLEQLVPALGNMSISREVEISNSSSDRQEGQYSSAVACASHQSSRTIPDLENDNNCRTERSSSNVYKYALKSLLGRMSIPTRVRILDLRDDAFIKRRHEPMDCRYSPY